MSGRQSRPIVRGQGYRGLEPAQVTKVHLVLDFSNQVTMVIGRQWLVASG
jgi:hypothetical protein